MEPNEFEEPTAVEGEVADEAPPEPVEGDEVQEAPIDTGDSKEEVSEEGRLGYRLPGQEDQTERQLRWYQENYANALSSLEAYRQKLDENGSTLRPRGKSRHYDSKLKQFSGRRQPDNGGGTTSSSLQLTWIFLVLTTQSRCNTQL